MENQIPSPETKSSFVNVFAWMMIFINGLGLLMSIIQNIIFTIIFRMDDFNNAFKDLGDFQGSLPAFFLRNIRLIIPLFGILILFAFISSIGLLKRKEWARKAFLFLLGFGILYTVAGSVFQAIFMKSMFHGADIPAEFHAITVFFIIFMIIFSVGFIFLFGWLFKKLSSEAIKTEFSPPVAITPEIPTVE